MIFKLNEVCEFINGGAWSDKEYVEKGIPGKLCSLHF